MKGFGRGGGYFRNAMTLAANHKLAATISVFDPKWNAHTLPTALSHIPVLNHTKPSRVNILAPNISYAVKRHNPRDTTVKVLHHMNSDALPPKVWVMKRATRENVHCQSCCIATGNNP